MKRAAKKYVDGWNQADKDDPLSDLNAPHAPRAKKNTRKWCKGKPGVEHQVETVVHHAATSANPCRPSQWMKDYWFCHHAIQCTVCGKYLREFLSRDECPDYRGQA